MKQERAPDGWSPWGILSQVSLGGLGETLPWGALFWHSQVWGSVEPSLWGMCLNV